MGAQRATENFSADPHMHLGVFPIGNIEVTNCNSPKFVAQAVPVTAPIRASGWRRERDGGRVRGPTREGPLLITNNHSGSSMTHIVSKSTMIDCAKQDYALYTAHDIVRILLQTAMC